MHHSVNMVLELRWLLFVEIGHKDKRERCRSVLFYLTHRHLHFINRLYNRYNLLNFYSMGLGYSLI